MSDVVQAGVACVDITPPAGLAMAGFAARVDPAQGAHDALTVRALVVNDTALLCADVIGIEGAMAARIRARAGMPSAIVAALHTHGGPVSMAGRAGEGADAAYLARLEDACVAALQTALAARRPATLLYGEGPDPGIAKNRRHPGGLTDPHLPVLAVRGLDGAWIAVLTAYACHPVVLGADNRLWTADYPGFVRTAIEAAFPQATALFFTGATADANTGHSAHASIDLAPQASRSFAEAERIGGVIAACVIGAPLRPMPGRVAAAAAWRSLAFERREKEPLTVLAARWRADSQGAEPAQAALLAIWANWAERFAAEESEPIERCAVRISALVWGTLSIAALPGEIFAETAHDIRHRGPAGPVMVIGFADDNPGYIPPRSEYPYGGYEVDEAHRYYGLPASFAPGSAEVLADAAISLLQDLKAA